MLLSKETLGPWFEQAASFQTFVAGADPGHQSVWAERFDRLELNDEQQAVVQRFERPMQVLCLTGRWCGDCALQGAALGRIALAAGELIDLRFLERGETTAELAVACMINAGMRVPVTFLMAQDGHPAACLGDRTLSRWRSMARKALGADANVSAPAPEDPVRAVLQEVLDEVERVQWLLRLSPRLRAMHGD
ncbi:MAG: thioredoxin family protein [Phycisphaerales bacterium]|nr:thioredoxin family protein [Phycisphaerales bacterium]